MDWKEYQKVFWQKYLYLENRVLETSKYVTIDEENFKVFSIVYEELLISICIEIESVFKEWTGEPGKIKDYINKIIKDNSMTFNLEAKIFFTNIVLKPFSELCDFIEKNENSNNKFNLEKILPWWYAYNKVKHDKLENYKKANLKNVLESLSALQILERMRIFEMAQEKIKSGESIVDSIDAPYESSKLFDIDIKTNYMFIAHKTCNILSEEIEELL